MQGDDAKHLQSAAWAVAVIAGFITILTFAWPWTPMAIRNDLNAEVLERKNLENVVRQMASVVELSATLNVEPKESRDYKDALAEIRRIRRGKIIQGGRN